MVSIRKDVIQVDSNTNHTPESGIRPFRYEHYKPFYFIYHSTQLFLAYDVCKPLWRTVCSLALHLPWSDLKFCVDILSAYR